MLAKNESGTMTYMHPDHIGSSNLITNSNGNEVESEEIGFSKVQSTYEETNWFSKSLYSSLCYQFK